MHMPCPQGVSIGIPTVAARASSFWLAGSTGTFVLPLEVSGEA